MNNKTYYEYLAIICGGIGPDAWDKEMTCSAGNMLKAADYFYHRAEEIGGQVVSIEQID